jgi:hypothetical protein
MGGRNRLSKRFYFKNFKKKALVKNVDQANVKTSFYYKTSGSIITQRNNRVIQKSSKLILTFYLINI